MVKYSNAAFALVALFAALSMGPTPANGLSHMGPMVRRHHPIGSEKMVKKIKRQGGVPILGGGENTATTGGAANTDTATSKASDTAKASDTGKASQTSDTSKATNTPNTNTQPTDTGSKSTTSNSSTSNTSTSNTPVNTPVVTPPTSTPNTSTPTVKNKPTILVTQTESSTQAADNSQAGSSAFSPRTWIILGSIVGGIIVIAALWTVIRKWKFSPSRKFEDRLEPIDWQPENATTGAAAGAGAGGAALARSNSHGSQRSNPTADEYHNRHMYAPNVAPEYPPADMYGGAAYADMHRGGTPQPQMDQLNHGPVYARGPYDGYDNGPAPYHQHAQDPYGGYAEQEYGAPAGPYRGY